MNSHTRSIPRVVRTSSGARSAFTLIELLVSLGVILVLIAISIPALRHARESARRAACMTNLRTFGQAIELHRGENDGELPYADRDINVTLDEIEPLDVLADQLGISPPGVDPHGAVRTASPFLCPSDTDTAASRGCSYFYSPYDLMSFYPRELSPRIITAYLSRDPTVVIFADNDPRHPGRLRGKPLTGTNVLRLDGGVEAGGRGPSVVPRG